MIVEVYPRAGSHVTLAIKDKMKSIRNIVAFSCMVLMCSCSSLPFHEKPYFSVSPTVAAEPITLKIGIGSGWIGYGPLYMAQDKGYFKDEGLQVELVRMGGLPGALAARQIDGRLATLDEMISQWIPGAPIAAILAIDESSGGDGILIRKDSNINSVKDLKGKTVALQRTTASHFFLNYLLQQNGMSEEDVTLRYMQAEEAAAAIVAGKVDVAVTWQPHLSEAAKNPSVNLFLTTKETPGLIVDVLILRKEVLAAHPEAGKRLVRAWNKAVEYHKMNPDDAAVIMAKALDYEKPEDFKADLAGVTFCGKERNAQLFSGSGPGTALGTVNFAIELWTKLGRITTPIKAEELIDAAYLEK